MTSMNGGMSDLALDVKYAITASLTQLADKAVGDGDADLRLGSYAQSNVSYRAAARYRRAAIAIRDDKPLHADDLATVCEVRARIERQLLAITEECAK